MENSEVDDRAIVQEEMNNPLLRGFFRDATGHLWFDRRYTFNAVRAAGVIQPRTPDLATSGRQYLAVSDELAAELGYNGA